MSIGEVLKKLEGKTIAKANLILQDRARESLDLVFTDGSIAVIEGNMQEINELKITFNE